MKRLLLLPAVLIWISALQAQDIVLPRSDNWSDTLLPAPELASATVKIAPIRTDKGLFGGKAGKGRMYCDIVLPQLTPELLIDVGMSMAQVPGIISMAPRWFAMFSPIACPQDELFSAAKCRSTIMITWRTYF